MVRSISRTARKAGLIVVAVIAAVVIMAFLAVFVIEQSHRLQSRTVAVRQFTADAEWWQHDFASIRKFEMPHGLDPEAHDGLRFAIDEWPDWKYLISIDVLDDGSAKGALRAVPYDEVGPVYERTFQLGKSETSLFIGAFDGKIDGYWGSTTLCTDGTGFQFERWKDGAVTSGRGNAACQRHYAELMGLVAETLVVNLKDVPFNWHSWLSAKRYLDLRGNGS